MSLLICKCGHDELDHYDCIGACAECDCEEFEERPSSPDREDEED